MKTSILMFSFMIVLFIGCGGKKETPPVQAGEMTDYKDPAYGFKMKYPKEWKQLGTAGKAVFVKSQEVANKFIDPASGEEGAQAVVEVLKLEGKTADEVIAASKEEMKQTWAQVDIQPDQQITVGGKQGIKVAYSVPVTSKTKITGYKIYVAGDTAVYKADFVGFGDQFTAHASVFEKMLQSFELPVVIIASDKWMASPNLETYTSIFFTMQYPENMEMVSQKKGDKDLVMEMRADRLDCSIHIDVFGAQGLTTEKAWEQNKGKYKAKSSGETKIDGNKANWVDYSSMKDIMSRAIFVVKNDKVIRVTLNWFSPQKDVYLTVLEQCVSSIKLK